MCCHNIINFYCISSFLSDKFIPNMSNVRSKRVSTHSSRTINNSSINRGFELLRNQYIHQTGQDMPPLNLTTTTAPTTSMGIMKTYENYRYFWDDPTLRRSFSGENASRLQVQSYLMAVSGHERPTSQVCDEHSYSMYWAKHPNPQLRVLPTQYLFMKNFPRHLTEMAEKAKDTKDELIDVVTVEDEMKKIPFLAPKVNFFSCE